MVDMVVVWNRVAPGEIVVEVALQVMLWVGENTAFKRVMVVTNGSVVVINDTVEVVTIKVSTVEVEKETAVENTREMVEVRVVVVVVVVDALVGFN